MSSCECRRHHTVNHFLLPDQLMEFNMYLLIHEFFYKSYWNNCNYLKLRYHDGIPCTSFDMQLYLKPMNHNYTLKWKLDIPLNVISMFTRWWNDKRSNTRFCDQHIYRLSHKVYNFYSNLISVYCHLIFDIHAISKVSC